MLTIFSVPKPFIGNIKTIQTNAIKSWLNLFPQPEIILIGNEKGTAEICKKYNLTHIPEIKYNEFGTPLLNLVFQQGQKNASFARVAYINADIILLDNITEIINFILQKNFSDFLLVGHRWNLKLTKEIKYTSQNNQILKNLLIKKGVLAPSDAIDYFIFPKGLYKKILPFALGRFRWDNWLIYYAVKKNIPVIDITAKMIAIHQDHNDIYFKNSNLKYKNIEVKYNERLISKKGNKWRFKIYTIMDASYVLTFSGIKKASLIRKLDALVDRYLAYLVISVKPFSPFSLPLIYFCRLIEKIRFLIKNFYWRKYL